MVKQVQVIEFECEFCGNRYFGGAEAKGHERKCAENPEVKKNSWTCPSCGKFHSKPHWKDHRQLGNPKKWDNWEGKGDVCAPSEMAFEFDKNGLPSPKFCPHCGYVERQPEMILLKVRK